MHKHIHVALEGYEIAEILFFGGGKGMRGDWLYMSLALQGKGLPTKTGWLSIWAEEKVTEFWTFLLTSEMDEY